MSAFLYDALASTDINNLLRRSARIISTALSADHILLLDFNAVDSNSCFNASIGWERLLSVEIGETLVEWAQHPDADELQDVTPDAGQLQGRIYIPSPVFLGKYNLATGLFVIVPCRDDRLMVLAGRLEQGAGFGDVDAGFIHAIMNMLSLAVERQHAELVHFRNMQQVLQAKHQWESTLDSLPQLVCLLDESGHVIRANRTLETWGLGDVTSVKGKQVHEVLHPDCNDWSCSLKNKCEEMWKELVDTEYVECGYHDSSTERDLSSSLCRGGKSQYQDGTEEEHYAFLVVEDISKQLYAERVLRNYNDELARQLQEKTLELSRVNAALKGEIEDHMRDGAALRESENKYTCLVETTLTGLYIVQGEHIVFCNSRFAEIFGYMQEEVSRLNMQQLFPTDEIPADTALNGQIEGTEWASDERIVRGITKDGKSIWLQRNLTRVDCLNESMMLGNVIDVTVQKNTEDALRLSQQELQILSEKLIQAQELERKRIASELHDSVGQRITAIKFGLENTLMEYKGTLPKSNMLYLQGAIENLRDTVEEVRKISMNLRPSMIDDLGLQATITWFTREFKSLFPAISVDTKIDIKENDLSDTLKVVIFRVIQESLNNIAKHAQANTVSVELLTTGDRLILSVKDDGKGFRLDSVYTGQGFGLSSMRERVKLTAGQLAVESAHGAGTVVHAIWPVEH